MKLKDKFDVYQSEIDPLAWEHYRSLEAGNRKRKMLYWFWFAGFAVMIGVLGVFLCTASSNGVVGVQGDRVETSNNGQEDIIQNHTFSQYVEAERAEIKIDFENIKNNHVEESRETTYIGQNYNQKSSQELQKRSSTFEHAGTEDSVSPQGDEIRTDKELEDWSSTIRQIHVSNEIQADSNTDDSSYVVEIYDTRLKGVSKMDLLDLSLFSIPLFKLEIDQEVDVEEEEDEKHLKRNHLMMSIGFADGFINGFAIDNPVQKQGVAIRLNFMHEWSEIIGTGLSIGYISAIDQANDQLVIKDSEIIRYLHARIYLSLVNEKRHQFRVYAGGGPTITDRRLGTFFMDTANGVIERRLQINTVSSIGIGVGAGYNYNLTESLSIGINGNIIAHNDGGWDVGVVFGYNF